MKLNKLVILFTAAVTASALCVLMTPSKHDHNIIELDEKMKGYLNLTRVYKQKAQDKTLSRQWCEKIRDIDINSIVISIDSTSQKLIERLVSQEHLTKEDAKKGLSYFSEGVKEIRGNTQIAKEECTIQFNI